MLRLMFPAGVMFALMFPGVLAFRMAGMPEAFEAGVAFPGGCGAASGFWASVTQPARRTIAARRNAKRIIALPLVSFLNHRTVLLPMPKKETREEEEPEGDGLKQLKKPTYAISVFFSLAGIFVALVLAFVINDALDETQSSINANLDGISAMLTDAENTASTLESEVSALDDTFNGLNGSISSLSEGLGGTGMTLKQFGNTLSQVSIPGLGLSQYGEALSASGDDILNGSARLKQVGELAEHRQNLEGLKSSAGSIRADLAGQRAKVAQTKQSISDVIGLIKLADFLVFVMFVTMFGVLILNSAAGIL